MGTIGPFAVNALLVGWAVGVISCAALLLFATWCGRRLDDRAGGYPTREEVERIRAATALHGGLGG